MGNKMSVSGLIVYYVSDIRRIEDRMSRKSKLKKELKFREMVERHFTSCPICGGELIISWDRSAEDTVKDIFSLPGSDLCTITCIECNAFGESGCSIDEGYKFALNLDRASPYDPNEESVLHRKWLQQHPLGSMTDYDCIEKTPNEWHAIGLKLTKKRTKESAEESKKALHTNSKNLIVKIRCRYCSGLYDQGLDKCPHCGATG